MQCDIIIPVWNQLSFTRDCIESIIRNTDIDYRFIIIDNASDGPTREYLESLKSSSRPPAIIIRNEKNLGFVKAVNQGLTASEAPAVCVMNNDTIAAKGWLEEMLRVLYSEKGIGIVNPSSNNLGQKPADGESVEHYAERLKAKAGGFIELGAAIGFCMLIKRELITKIGLFDEIYGMGNFEDTDFSRRAIKEGYRCVRALAAYVYHRENTSFNMVKTHDEDFRRNRAIYEFRWGKPRRVVYILDSWDENRLRRIEFDSMKVARDGGWVWYISKDDLKSPQHSNIILRRLSQKWFYPKALFEILKKKKKFDEIYVGDERLGAFLERLIFIHKAKVRYY